MSQDATVPPAKVQVDEADRKDGTSSASAGPSSGDSLAQTNSTAAVASTSSLSLSSTPPASSGDDRRNSGADDYYSSRRTHDRLGNPIPDRSRRPGAMSSVYGTSKVRLPGDLGAKDPRRPKSPAPASLPGDLGPNDPRRASSTGRSPAPQATHSRNASEEGITRVHEDPEPERHDSDDDADADNDNDTDGESRRGRGRKRPEPGRTTSGKAINVREDSEDSEREPHFAAASRPDPTKGQSKLGFLREQKRSHSENTGSRRVHPSTAFDAATSGAGTPLQSDSESHSELRAAQKLSLTMSAIHSTPSAHRVIRQIIRGDFEHFQRQAEEGRKRQRMYLVATDLSPEAEYALEWTIGTVLRDGDTLIAVYAADEELVGSSGEGGVEIGAGADSVKDTAAIVKGLPALQQAPMSPGPSPLAKSAGAQDARSRSRGVYSSAEVERRRMLEDVTSRCVRLLRKTRLQVRVVVEVFHCKSPRHMITEVIDYLSPTLVIIGSRGRSAVKGVLLGSFSNYLVTKSSVPVMVARKKLRKHSKTTATRNPDGTAIPYQGTGRTGRFSNIIEAPKKKGLRVKGWDEVGID